MTRLVAQDPLQTWRWYAEIDGVRATSFSEVSGLESEVEIVPYAEGGMDTDQKSPGRKVYTDIVLKTGVFEPLQPGATDLSELAKRSHELDQPYVTAEPRFGMVIVQVDNYGRIARRYEVDNCIVKKWQPTSTMNTASQAHYQTLTIAHEGFTEIVG